MVLPPELEQFFAGPRRDAWRQARRQFRHVDQWRVIWATHRNRQVSRARLAVAQLVYVRYLQDAYRRAPLLRYRWLRTALPASYGVLAAGYGVFAVTQSQGRIVHSMMATGWALGSLTWGMVGRSARRKARLLAEIERAHGIPPEESDMPWR